MLIMLSKFSPKIFLSFRTFMNRTIGLFNEFRLQLASKRKEEGICLADPNELGTETRLHYLFSDLNDFIDQTEKDVTIEVLRARFTPDALRFLIYFELEKTPFEELHRVNFPELSDIFSDPEKQKAVSLCLSKKRSDDRRWSQMKKDGKGWANIVDMEEGIPDSEKIDEKMRESHRKRIQRAVERFDEKKGLGIQLLLDATELFLESFMKTPALLKLFPS